MKVKEESEKAGLKLNTKKMKLMASTPITSWHLTSAMKLKDTLLGRRDMTNLDSILKSRDITLPSKVCLVKEIYPEYSWEGLMLKLKLQYFGHFVVSHYTEQPE